VLDVVSIYCGRLAQWSHGLIVLRPECIGARRPTSTDRPRRKSPTRERGRHERHESHERQVPLCRKSLYAAASSSHSMPRLLLTCTRDRGSAERGEVREA
jgi:hypothetical protein